MNLRCRCLAGLRFIVTAALREEPPGAAGIMGNRVLSFFEVTNGTYAC
jgi:hypothetical protein